MYSYYIVGCYHHYVDDPLGENMCVYVWVFAFRRSSLLTFHVIGYLIELPSICKRFVMLLWWGLKKLWPKCKYMYIHLLTNLEYFFNALKATNLAPFAFNCPWFCLTFCTVLLLEFQVQLSSDQNSENYFL